MWAVGYIRAALYILAALAGALALVTIVYSLLEPLLWHAFSVQIPEPMELLRRLWDWLWPF